MPPDIAVSAVSPRQGAALGTSAQASATQAPAQPDPASVAASSKRPLVNPSLHLDLALNLVVLQFIDDKGDVTNTIPTASQLKAYKAQQTEPSRRNASEVGSRIIPPRQARYPVTPMRERPAGRDLPSSFAGRGLRRCCG